MFVAVEGDEKIIELESVLEALAEEKVGRIYFLSLFLYTALAH